MRTHIVISSKRTGKRQKKRIVNRNADAFSDEQKSKINKEDDDHEKI